MKKLQIFDPPMCCSSGVCGTNVDTKLVKFLNNIEWLKSKGIKVEKFGLAFEPAAFVNNEIVKNMLQTEGNDCLPLILLDNQIVYKGMYPDRAKLAEICGVEFEQETATEVSESIALGCGPDCDCHNSPGDNRCKNAVIFIILLLIVFILFVKFACKAGAATASAQTQQSQPIAGFVSSISEAKKSGQDTAFIFVPSKSNLKMSVLTQTAIIAAQKSLKAKKVTSKLYSLDSTSADYTSIAAKNALPAIVVVGKTGKRSIISGKVTVTKLLQAYVEVSQVGCGSDCPCHQK